MPDPNEAIEVHEDGSADIDLSKVDTNPLRTPQPSDENFPPMDSKRFKKIYAKSKQYDEAVEQLEDLKTKMSEMEQAGTSTKEMIDAMRKHNADLTSAIQQSVEASTAATTATTTASKSASIEAEISSLEDKATAARAALDFDEFAKFNQMVYNKKAELEKITTEPTKKPGSKVADQPPSKVELSPEVKEFAEKHPWSISNPAMYQAALAQETLLRVDPKWSGKAESEIYSEVGRLVEEMYDYNKSGKIEESTQKSMFKPAMKAGAEPPGSSRKPNPGDSNKVRLNSEQRQMAKNLGVSEVDYAKQLQLIGQGSRDVRSIMGDE